MHVTIRSGCVLIDAAVMRQPCSLGRTNLIVEKWWYALLVASKVTGLRSRMLTLYGLEWPDPEELLVSRSSPLQRPIRLRQRCLAKRISSAPQTSGL